MSLDSTTEDIVIKKQRNLEGAESQSELSKYYVAIVSIVGLNSYHLVVGLSSLHYRGVPEVTL